MLHRLNPEELFSDPARQGNMIRALQGGGVGMWDLQLKGVPSLAFDDRCREILGLKNGNSLIYETAFAQIHPDDRPAVGAALQKAQDAASGGFFDVSYRLKGIDDGILRTVRSVGSVTFDADGVATGATGISIHADEERVFREERQKLDNMINNSPDFMGISNNDGTIEYLNKAAFSLFGIDEGADLRRLRVDQFYPADQLERMPAVTEAVNRDGRWEGHVTVRHFKTGELIPAYGTYEKIIDQATGKQIGRSVTMRDLRREYESQRALRESEARFRELIEKAPIATCVFKGRELLIEIANGPMIRFWGKGPGVIGKTLTEALPEVKGQFFLPILHDMFDTAEPFESKEGEVKLMIDGELKTFYFNFTYQPLFDNNGKVYAIMAMAVEVTEQVMSRRQLERSQQQLLANFDQAPVAIALIDEENLTFRMANPFYAALVGREREAIINRPLLEALPELKGQGFDDLLRGVISTGKPYIAKEVSVNLLRNDKNETIYVDLNYQPNYDTSGKITGVLVVATDVTSQVISRKELEESALFIRTVFDESPVAKMVYTGRDMVIRDMNKRMLEIFGRDTKEEFLGKTLMEAAPELLNTPLFERYQYVLTTGETYVATAERMELHRYGEPRWGYYDYIYKALRSTTGEIYGVICTAVDVTDQVMSQLEIEEGRLALQDAIDLAGLGTWNIDLRKRVLNYDERLRSWFGYTADEVISPERASEPVIEEHRALVRERMIHAITPGSDGVYDVEYQIRNLVNGQERILHAQGRTMLDSNGEPYVVRGTVQDVTRERKLELELTHQVQERTEELAAANEELQSINEEMSITYEEMEEANRNLFRSNEELSQYAYVASHDLQEPLRKIRVFSGILSKQESLTKENRPLVEKINRSAERMSLLIKDLLEFSRLIKSEKIYQPVDLNEIIGTVLTDFELAIAEKKARITFAPLPVINAVPLQMNQLFYNIMSNALKFTRPEVDPEITMKVEVLPHDEVTKHLPKAQKDMPYYDICVRDNGIGFDEKYAEHIFEVFKRLHAREVYPGSGIGLALCRRIVSNHDGYLYAESVPGEGTAFHIVLPGVLQS